MTAAQAAAEQQVLTLLNRHRAVVDVPALALDGALSLAAREHSCEMFRWQDLRHESHDGSSPFQRFTAHGVAFTVAGENIGASAGMGISPAIGVLDADMMAEPLSVAGSHHWNIVHAGYTEVGVGLVAAKGQVWLTEDFAG